MREARSRITRGLTPVGSPVATWLRV